MPSVSAQNPITRDGRITRRQLLGVSYADALVDATVGPCSNAMHAPEVAEGPKRNHAPGAEIESLVDGFARIVHAVVDS